MDDFFSDVNHPEDNPFASDAPAPATFDATPDATIDAPATSDVLSEVPVEEPVQKPAEVIPVQEPPKPVEPAQSSRPVSVASSLPKTPNLNRETPFTSLFEIKVSDPEKKGEGMNAHMVYTINTKTTSTEFQNPSMSVSRRFTNFVWLYNQLTTKYPGIIVPPIPEKQALGRFDTEFVEQRRAALENCLCRIAAHLTLSKSPDFKMFLEASDLEAEIKKKEPKKSLFSSLTTSMTDAVQNAAHTFSKIPETDEWFENKRAQLETLETHLKSLTKVLELFIKQRKELAVTSGEFGDSVTSLGSSEFSKSLGACLAQLGEVEKKIKDILNQQASIDEQYVGFVVDEYLRLIGSVKIALEARIKAYSVWKTSESSLAKKKEQLTKVSQQGNKSKTSALEAEVDEGEKAVEKAKEGFLDITETLRRELSRIDQEKIDDFQKALVKFVEAMIENQKKVISLWEDYLPKVQAL